MTLILITLLFLHLRIFVIKNLSPHDICQGIKKSLLADTHKSWGYISASELLKVYPPDFPKDETCYKHPPKSITFKGAFSFELFSKKHSSAPKFFENVVCVSLVSCLFPALAYCLPHGKSSRTICSMNILRKTED